MSNSHGAIPELFLKKWQNISDLLAKIMDIPAALIMRTDKEYMEVLISSNSSNNPYHPGDKKLWHGLYCETVIKTQQELHIPNALKDKKWDKNTDIKLGMIAYFGIPLNFANKQPFGTICLLDNKEKEFSNENKALLYQFKNVIELDLALIESLDWNEHNMDIDIIHRLTEQNKKYLAQNQELFHSHRLMSYIIKHDPYGIAVLDNNLTFLFVSKRFLSDYNFTTNDVVGKHHYEVLPEIPDKWKRVHQRALNGETINESDDIFIREDGTVEHTRWECRPWRHHDGSIGGIIVYTELITEQTKLEDTTREAYNLIKNLAAQVPGVIYQYCLYPDGRTAFPFSSEGMYDIYELTPEEVKEDATAVLSRLHPEDLDYVMNSIFESAKNQTLFQCKFRVVLPAQGLRWRQSNATPELLEDGSTLWHGIITDITYEQSKEELLKEKNEEINTFFDCSLDLLCITDEKGYFIRLNNEWENVFGYSLNEMEGKKFMDFVHPGDYQFTQQAMSELKRDNIITNLTNRYLCKNGSYRWIEWKYTLVGNRAFAAARDITDKKKINEELVFAKEKAEESNRLKTEFLNNMSHEIRTPLNGIIGFSEMLKEPQISYKKRDYYTKIVRDSSYQLLKIIEDILEISALETNKVQLFEEIFSLNELLAELFSFYEKNARERDILLILEKGESDQRSCILSDKTKLSKILCNLLENALKYTDEGFIKFGYRVDNERLVLYVKDTGIGICPESIDTIFDRFSQEDKELSKRHGGLGLGLSLSRENAKILGGNITVESEKGTGSAFFVNIPYKKAKPANFTLAGSHTECKKANFTERPENKKFTVLIAEDEEINFLYLDALFKKEFSNDYTTLHVWDGKEAVDACSHDSKIDIVLMDIKMPVMNGYEAARKIKSQRPDIKIIAQTAYSTAYDKELALKNGCDDYISKPINKEKLLTMISKYTQ